MFTARWSRVASVAALSAGLFVLAASEELAAASKEQEAIKYMQDLKTSKDSKAKVTALVELAKIGQVSKPLVAPAMPEILKMLKDKDSAVRAAAAEALGKLDPDPKEAIPALVSLMKADKTETVRMAAIKGLGSMGPNAKDANKELRDLMKVEDKKSKLSMAANNALRSINAKNQ